jgi:ferric-dicitrate binding protein FerR (iron transport regulator)
MAAAAEWLTRLEGRPEPKVWDEFERWVGADRRHEAAFIRIRCAWQQVDRLRLLRPLDGKIDADLLDFLNEDRALGRRNEPRAKKSPELTSIRRTTRDRNDWQSRILLLPGTRLAAIAEFILTRESFRRYVRPMIADMQDEYVECIAKGDEWRARWVAVRGHFLVVPGWMYALVSRAVRRIFSL